MRKFLFTFSKLIMWICLFTALYSTGIHVFFPKLLTFIKLTIPGVGIKVNVDYFYFIQLLFLGLHMYNIIYQRKEYKPYIREDDTVIDDGDFHNIK